MGYNIRKKMKEVEEIVGFTCDGCGTTYYNDEKDWIEFQERYQFYICGGYGSVFGDGIEIELVFCQHCLKNMLETFIDLEEE